MSSRALRTHLPQRGLTVFFTGLSAAGKTTLANALSQRFLAAGRTDVTLLDGDVVRRWLSAELGFSREHRDMNVLRIGFVAQAVTRSGGVAICAAIAPYAAARRQVRAMVTEVGDFLLVHVATPITVCERRDPKGLYAAARAGRLHHFTGISDPYEPPDDADLVLDTSRVDVQEATNLIVQSLEAKSLLSLE